MKKFRGGFQITRPSIFFLLFLSKGRGGLKMEIERGLREWFESIDGDENRRQHLKAFGDFCLDLLEEEYGGIPPEEEIDAKFVKGLLIHT